MTCPHCDKNLPEGLIMCFHCGGPLEASVESARPERAAAPEPEIQAAGTACPHCHNSLPDGLRACFHCGKTLRESAAPTNPPRQVEATPQPHQVEPTPPPRLAHAQDSGLGAEAGGNKRGFAGIIAAVAVVLLLGGAVGGHFLGLYTLPLLPSITDAGEIDLTSISGTPDATQPPPSGTPTPTIAPPIESAPAPAHTEFLAQKYLDIFSGGEYYVRFRAVEGNFIDEQAWNGHSRYMRYEGGSADTEHIYVGEALAFTIDHNLRTYTFFPGLTEAQNINVWSDFLYTSSGIDEFAGMALPYETYWGFFFGTPVQFFFKDGGLYGVRRMDYEYFVEEISDTIPYARFDIPAGYLSAWAQTPEPTPPAPEPTPAPIPTTPTPTPAPQASLSTGVQFGTYVSTGIHGSWHWELHLYSNGRAVLDFMDFEGYYTVEGTWRDSRVFIIVSFPLDGEEAWLAIEEYGSVLRFSNNIYGLGVEGVAMYFRG